MKISIIIPVFNENDNVEKLLSSLQILRSSGHEVIVVDGGSDDGTENIARPLCDKFIESQKGRATQMNTGAGQASGKVLWFLHADSRIAEQTLEALPDLLKEKKWGWFDVRLSGSKMTFRLIERMMNLRSRATGIATGDQGIFVARNLFNSVDGYPDLPLMEEIALSKKLRRKFKPVALNSTITTSSRRWEVNGILPTVLLMWQLRLRYFFGTDPELLVSKYYK